MSRLVIVVLIFSVLAYSCSDELMGGKKKTDVITKDEVAEEDVVDRVVPEKLNPREYISWIDDKKNGLKVEKMIGEFTYMFQYKPSEYVAVLDLKKDSIKKIELQKKAEEYSGLQYCNFRISSETGGELLKKNVTQSSEYDMRIQYFSFDMQKDIKLIDANDTLDCVLFHFERVFGLAPYATFLLGFPLTKNLGDKTLFFDDKIFGSGNIYLTIQSKNIKQLPSVIVH